MLLALCTPIPLDDNRGAREEASLSILLKFHILCNQLKNTFVTMQTLVSTLEFVTVGLMQEPLA